ncbi:late embryogenesis abundant protein D-34-like [Rhodamnia argentea]|uniref:Late embryogenesis abundant protein D-34-like n=1 Tax=Rhodamnia argentea TaxID=178133 RepID=A0A8B8Q8J6_9MYRT|nr:late embryogenesis abundant protein D-34-like [Rhodamnia argentea]
MSQDQPQRPEQGQAGRDPVKYGDVFDVSSDLASKPIAPQDAAMMQTAEAVVFGQTQKGSPAAVMQSAATRNEQAGLVGHRDATDVAKDQGVTVTETDVPGQRIITEAVAGQVVGQYVEPTPVQHSEPAAVVEQSAITIGEALEAVALTVGGKPVEQSDAAAIQAAEVRATGSNVISPGGLAASAQSAAAHNEGVDRDEDKIKLGDVLTGAKEKLPADKAATRQDAEGVASAELRNNPNVVTQPGGVAASVAAAARLNEAVNP